MTLKETTTMEQKIGFIFEWRTGKDTITDLCESFGISRPIAYKLIYRFEKITDSTLNLKKKHPRWGAKKMRVLLFNELPNEDIPSVVTVHNIPKKNQYRSRRTVAFVKKIEILC